MPSLMRWYAPRRDGRAHRTGLQDPILYDQAAVADDPAGTGSVLQQVSRPTKPHRCAPYFARRWCRRRANITHADRRKREAGRSAVRGRQKRTLSARIAASRSSAMRPRRTCACFGRCCSRTPFTTLTSVRPAPSALTRDVHTRLTSASACFCTGTSAARTTPLNGPGYVQGMADLLAPILAVMDDEVDTFWCFVGFMDRMVSGAPTRPL